MPLLRFATRAARASHLSHLTKAAALAAFFVAGLGAAQAAMITVTTDDDNATPDGDCTLREAITSANMNSNADEDKCVAGEAGVTDLIVFDFNALEFGVTVDSPLPTITGAVTIDGTISNTSAPSPLDPILDLLAALTGGGGGSAPPAPVVIDGGGTTHLFVVSGTGVTLFNMTLQNGRSAGNGGAIVVQGGDGLASGGLTLDTVLVQNSSAGGTGAGNGGGAIANAGTLTITNSGIDNNDANGAAGNGGGILNTGTLIVSDSVITNNSATRAGGGVEQVMGSASFTNTLLDANSVGPSPGNGGAVHVSAGNTTFTEVTVSNNTAAQEGGGLWNNAGFTMTVTGSDIIGNSAAGAAADDGGGGIFNNGGTLLLSQTTVSGNQATGMSGSGGGVFNATGGTLTITGGSFADNSAQRAGGGIEEASGVPATPGTPNPVTLQGVSMSGNNAGTSPGNGGAIHISANGNISILGGSFTGNTATEGGALWNGSGSMTVDSATITGNIASGDAANEGGGGIFNNGGSLVVTDSSIDGNFATGTSGSGGGIFNNAGGTISVTGGSISGNAAARAGGGIEDASGVSAAAGTAVTLTDVTLADNSAGDVDVDADGTIEALANPGNGGALHVSANMGISGDIVITDSVVTGNFAAQEGGGLWNGAANMTITGGSITENTAAGDAADDGGGGIFNNGGTVTIATAGSTTTVDISGNAATGTSGSGGGILNLNGTVTVSDAVISANSANRAGGGIENAGGTVTLTRVTLGGLAFSDGNNAGLNPGNGGGLHTGGAGTVTVDDSTVSRNIAAEGGGLWNSGSGSLTVSNSTVSNNVASKTGGGGIFANGAGGVITLINATIAANGTNGDGGGINNAALATLNASNTLIATNNAIGVGPDVAGTITANFTLIGNTAGAMVTGSNNQLNVDPQIGPLGLNGGPTATHALGFASPAVDAADESVCNAPPISNLDQRGFGRDFDGDEDGTATCDIGAFERNDNPVVTFTGNGPVTITAMPGDTNVPALAVTLTNGNAGTPITLNGFSGSLSGSGNFQTQIAATRLVLDADADGMVDAGETDLTMSGQASVTVNEASGDFAVTFTPPGRNLAGGTSESYILAIDIAATTASNRVFGLTALAGGGGLLALLGVSAFGRRRRLSLALSALLLGLALAGCGGDGGGGSGGGGGGGGDTPPPTPSFQFTVNQLNAAGPESQAIGGGLPLNGPQIMIQP